MFSNLKRSTYGREVCFDSRLISQVKARPFIYDKQHKDYRNTELKDLQWKKIAAELNTDVERCKKRWGSLRDRYKRIKRHELLEGTGIRPYNRWRYYEVLRFIPFYSDTVVDYCQTDDTNEDTNTLLEIAGEDTVSSPTASNRKRDHDLTGYFSSFAEDIKEPASSRTRSPDATDQFFKYIAHRVKRANLTSFEEMQVEAAILNFTIAKIAKIQSET